MAKQVWRTSEGDLVTANGDVLAESEEHAGRPQKYKPGYIGLVSHKLSGLNHFPFVEVREGERDPDTLTVPVSWYTAKGIYMHGENQMTPLEPSGFYVTRLARRITGEIRELIMR